MTEIRTIWQIALGLDDLRTNDEQLAQLLTDGWQIVNVTATGHHDELDYTRYVMLVRTEPDDDTYIPF